MASPSNTDTPAYFREPRTPPPLLFSPRSPNILAVPGEHEHILRSRHGVAYEDLPEDAADRFPGFGRNGLDKVDPRIITRESLHFNAVQAPWNIDREWFNTQAQIDRHRLTVRETNVPDRHELFLLQDEEKKVVVQSVEAVSNSKLFTFNREDHTLGNLLRSRLLTSQHVIFAGYRVPHPLFPTFELRVQTDGSLTPQEALMTACRDVVQDLASLGREFTKEWELKKMVGDGQTGGDTFRS
ncbi:MAG: DNA-directed RNA polymerase II core subunit [Vezdaea aestivalis]|nr:MAG: DNA-directed RNA polymerase II core subunit [Vezdaea aestivalis]